MSNQSKLICDRCGKELKGIAIFPFMSGRLKTVVKFGVGKFDYSMEDFDFCKDCTKEVIAFLRGKQND